MPTTIEFGEEDEVYDEDSSVVCEEPEEDGEEMFDIDEDPEDSEIGDLTASMLPHLRIDPRDVVNEQVRTQQNMGRLLEQLSYAFENEVEAKRELGRITAVQKKIHRDILRNQEKTNLLERRKLATGTKPTFREPTDARVMESVVASPAYQTARAAYDTFKVAVHHYKNRCEAMRVKIAAMNSIGYYKGSEARVLRLNQDA